MVYNIRASKYMIVITVNSESLLIIYSHWERSFIALFLLTFFRKSFIIR
nr:MAG TPA: hypothetical protein [Bacteriophage sp.]